MHLYRKKSISRPTDSKMAENHEESCTHVPLPKSKKIVFRFFALVGLIRFHLRNKLSSRASVAPIVGGSYWEISCNANITLFAPAPPCYCPLEKLASYFLLFAT